MRGLVFGLYFHPKEFLRAVNLDPRASLTPRSSSTRASVMLRLLSVPAANAASANE